MRVLNQDEDREFRELDRDECLHVLGWESIGRLATCVAGEAPEVVPVNFVLDGDTVLFRSNPHRAARLINRRASFEIDRFDPFRKLGWSVLISGTIGVVPEGECSETICDAWAPGERNVILWLVPDRVTGREIAQRPTFVSSLGYL